LLLMSSCSVQGLYAAFMISAASKSARVSSRAQAEVGVGGRECDVEGVASRRLVTAIAGYVGVSDDAV
jgi:hypothetical protein